MRWRKNRSARRGDSQEALFEVTGMSCGSCVARIEEVLAGQSGVKDAKVDLASGQARVSLTASASTDTIIEAVTEAGYTMTPLS